MRIFCFSIAAAFASLGAFAASPDYRLLETNVFDFAAPVVYDKTNLTEANVGTIVYDADAGAFYGLTPTGAPSSGASWIQLGGTTNSSTVTSSGNVERVERVSFGGSTYYTACTASPCTINSQSGTWVTSVTRAPAGGSYTINFAAGAFSDIPTCTCSAFASSVPNNAICSLDNLVTPSANSISFNIRNAANGMAADGFMMVTCQGPR